MQQCLLWMLLRRLSKSLSSSPVYWLKEDGCLRLLRSKNKNVARKWQLVGPVRARRIAAQLLHQPPIFSFGLSVVDAGFALKTFAVGYGNVATLSNNKSFV